MAFLLGEQSEASEFSAEHDRNPSGLVRSLAGRCFLDRRVRRAVEVKADVPFTQDSWRRMGVTQQSLTLCGLPGYKRLHADMGR
jgi:hypothetical protein